MSSIRIDNFGGKIPRQSARLLPPNYAQIATNCKLFSGELRGWNQALLDSTLTPGYTANTVYRIPNTPSDTWFTSQYSNVHIEKSPLVNDSYDRYYWSSGTDDVPRYNTLARLDNGDPDLRLGAPAPTVAPTDGGSPPTGGSSNIVVDRVFVYTFVSEYGEESAPSPPLTLTGQTDDTWTLGGMQVETDIADYTERKFTAGTKKIYRTITSLTGQTNFFFVKEIAIGTTSTTVSDADSTVAFNDLLGSTGWTPPPAALEGIIAHPNGFLVGFVGRDLYFSEPYRPHAWPDKYRLSCDSEIMGLGIVGNTIGVTTQSNPYGCTGINPAFMSLTKSTTVEPCVSKKGVVTLPNGIYYPSNNGLAWLQPSGAQVITQELVTREEWVTDFSPSTLNACRYGTRYFAFKDTNSAFIYDPLEERLAIIDIEHTGSIEDVFTDDFSGLVYLLDSNRIYEWDPTINTIPISYTWKSKVYEFTEPINMGAGIIKFNDSDFTVDSSFLATIQGINSTIFGTYPPLAGFNSRAFNGTRNQPNGTDVSPPSYASDLNDNNLYQSGSFNGSDLVNEASYSSQVASTVVAVYADGVEKFRSTVAKNTMFRLPAGYKAHTYEIEIVSNTDVYSIAIASVGKELKKV